ncbi:hypothetical protein SAMN05216326_1583 [Nitrosomonas marina]|uniref:PLL-like beta propeller domain-containing protein n=1 Tax=Nitrosomonas marina TaxID=917 RepID=A0A1I0GAI8_9PROT|nr:hypothetical protein [Nitrosomonas marina]SET67127.1 hypothetical protein SAMN05216326_1583 [Nitrosomonas marina]
MAIHWSNWASLGKAPSELSRPFVQRNQDGRLEVFARGSNGIFNIWQRFPNAGWHERWFNLGKPSGQVRINTHVVGRNADGRQEMFAAGDDNTLWQKWQVVPNGGWSEWKLMNGAGGAPAVGDRFTAGSNQDGRQEISAVGGDGDIWQIWQTVPNGGWSHWSRLGRPPVDIRQADRITVGSNLDGRQELFVVGRDDALWHIWQVAPNVGWSDWESLGKPRDLFDGSEPPKDRDLSEPVVQENPDGHLEVFVPGNKAFCNRWQEAPNSSTWRHEGWNEKPPPRPNVGIHRLEAALDARRRRVEVVAVGDDGALWHAWQIFHEPFWSKWENLGTPPAGIQQADRLTVGTNQDHRLEVFVTGKDGAIWHIWQTH